ncbi:MAG TPA: ABC transporter permease [Solirubrobacterales bacterium]
MSTVQAAAPGLREVRGPSAVGGGRRRFAELLWLISVTEFKKTYFGTVLGYFWSLARPLMLFGVLLFVFTRIFRLGSNVPNYAVLLLFNIVLFGYLQETTSAAVGSVLAQEDVVRKTQFPRLVIPLAVVLTGLFNLGLNLIAVFAFILAYGVDPTWTWLLLPVIVAAVTVLTTALSLLVSALFVRFRDVAIIWGLVLTVLFYGTPILYPIEAVPSEFRHALLWNPLAAIFEQSRAWIIDPSAPGAVSAAGGWDGLIPAIAIFLAVCAAGVWVFRREAPRIAEAL